MHILAVKHIYAAHVRVEFAVKYVEQIKLERVYIEFNFFLKQHGGLGIL